MLTALLASTVKLRAQSHPEGSWRTVFEDQGVTILEKVSIDGGPTFRARVTLESSLCEVFAVLRDIDTHPSWVDGCVEARILAEEGRNRFLTYNRTSAGRFKLFGVHDRVVVLRTTVRRNDAGDRIQIAFKSVDREISGLSGGDAVRLLHLRGYYDLKQIAPRRTVVEYQSNIDPAGSLPSFITRYALRTVPFRSLDGLRNHLRRGPASASLMELREDCRSWVAADPSTLQ